uniref:Ornithine decarboxylase n=1 Tax=Angiostrongylus cantonensis TaxID=6313 RepID=A0A158P7Y5_ANGCA
MLHLKLCRYKMNGMENNTLDVLQKLLDLIDRSESHRHQRKLPATTLLIHLYSFQCLKEIYCVLKPGAHLTPILDLVIAEKNRNNYPAMLICGEFTRFQDFCVVYSFMGGEFPGMQMLNDVLDALGLGALWGKEKALKVIKEAGFSVVGVVPTPQFVISILYVCKK